MANHTPGPWEARSRLGTRVAVTQADLHYFEVKSVDIQKGDYVGEVWSEADARLIAAAPELLGALKFILAFYEPGQRHLDTDAWKVAEASARAAVAKAQGETP